MKQKRFAAVLCALLLAALTACGNGGSSSPAAPAKNASAGTEANASQGGEEKVTLTFMHYYTKEEADAGDATRILPRETLQQYMEEHPEVEVKTTELQHNDYETKMQALAAANDLPDVYVAKGSWTENFVDSGLMMDITDELNACEWKDQYRDPDVLFKPVTYGERIYGAPTQYSSTSIVYYNEELWKDAGYDSFPQTWEELFAAVPKFEEMGVTTIAFGNKDKWNYNSSWISTIADRFTGPGWTESIIAKDGQANFTDAEFVGSLELTQRIGASGALNPDYASVNNQQATMQFLQGKAATLIDGYWAVEYMNANMEDGFADKVGIVPLPGVNGGKGDQGSITACCGWFLAGNGNLEGDKKAIAADFMFYQTGPALSQRYSDAGQIGPCVTTASANAQIAPLNQKYLNFIDTASSSVQIYDALINGSVIAVMNDQFPELLAGTTTPEAAAAAIQSEFESIMK